MVQAGIPSLPSNIRAELARRGKTQADLAELLGITRQAISRRLTGTVPFGVDELAIIADYFDVTIGDLLIGVAS